MTQNTTLADELDEILIEIRSVINPTIRQRGNIDTIEEAAAALRHSAGDAGAVEAALEPVMHWYQSDEHPKRPLAEIVTDVVADLQHDRKIALASRPEAPPEGPFKLGDRVTKTKGSSWTGIVVGTYSTSLTPIGYAVESENEPGSVQFYPAALRATPTKEPTP